MKRILDVEDARRLVVVTPDNYRPDLVSPVGRNKSPRPPISPRRSRLPMPNYLPKHVTLDTDPLESSGVSHLQYSDDFEPTTVASVSRTAQTYSADFNTEDVSLSSNSVEYTEDFDPTSRSSLPSRHVRNTSHSGKLDTLPSSQIETVDEDLSTVADTHDLVLTSGRTSRLTWQYSEDFEDVHLAESDGSSVRTVGSESSPLAATGDEQWTESAPEDVSESSQWSHTSSDATCTQAAEKQFLDGLIRKLKHSSEDSGEPRERLAPRAVPYDETNQQHVHPKASSPEKKAFRKFCKTLSEHIMENPDTKGVTKHARKKDLKLHLLGIKSDEPVEHYGVSHYAINKLRLENTQAKLEKMAKEEIHEPKKCANCIAVRSELAEAQFLKDKLHVAQERNIQAKLEQAAVENMATHLVKDPTVLPGHIQTELGHLDPGSIWNKLVKRDSELPVGEREEFQRPPQTLKTMCPHLMDSSFADEVNDHMAENDENLEGHESEMRQMVEKVKKELSDEVRQLDSLSSPAFWKLYFAKLTNHEQFPTSER